MDWRQGLAVLAQVLVVAREYYHLGGYLGALVGRQVSRLLVVLVEQVDPTGQLLVLVVTTTDPNRHHFRTLWVQQVGYLADPMHLAKKGVSPTVVVPPYSLHLAHSTQQTVEEPGLVGSSLRPIAVELDFAHPMERVVVEQEPGDSSQPAAVELGFVRPTLRPVVEGAFVPNPVFVVVELGFVRPTLRPVVVEQAFVDPILVVVAEHPMYWVVDQVGSKNLRLPYFPVGSIPVVEPVVPDVANLKVQQH
jgi:hypothetical protein